MPLPSVSLLMGGFANVSLQDFIILILVLLISLPLHEAAHAYAAHRLGDDTAAAQGRLTLNPLAHLDPIGSLAFLIAGIGWARPVPVNPVNFDRRFTQKRGWMITSVAGPASNLALATLAAILFYGLLTVILASGSQGQGFLLLQQFFNRLYFLNIILAVFNLLPVPPLDGFKIFGAFLPDRLYYGLMGIERYIGLVFIVFILLGRGFLGRILSAVAWPFNQVILMPLDGLFNWLWQTLGLIA